MKMQAKLFYTREQYWKDVSRITSCRSGSILTAAKWDFTANHSPAPGGQILVMYPLLACDFSSDILLLILVPDIKLVSFVFAQLLALCLVWWPCCLVGWMFCHLSPCRWHLRLSAEAMDFAFCLHLLNFCSRTAQSYSLHPHNGPDHLEPFQSL